MQSGKIFVADVDGANVIKMVGDVRLTLCISFDQFIDQMYAKTNFHSVIFDLRETEAIDSTTLGLMAKISILFQERFHQLPLVISPNSGINRLLESMGFEDIFEIISNIDLPIGSQVQLREDCKNEAVAKQKVIEAHKILMGLNEVNRQEFNDLVKSLEQK